MVCFNRIMIVDPKWHLNSAILNNKIIDIFSTFIVVYLQEKSRIWKQRKRNKKLVIYVGTCMKLHSVV